MLKNSTLITDGVTLDGELAIQGPDSTFVSNGDFKVNDGASLVLNNSVLIMNVSDLKNPKLELVPGARMSVTKSSKITNGVIVGGINSTFQFIVNAREYSLGK